MPPAGELDTCDTAGVLGATAGIVASLQSALAIRLLVSGDGRRLEIVGSCAVLRELRLHEERRPCATTVTRTTSPAADPRLRAVLREYLEWAVREVLSYSAPGSAVTRSAPMPRWSWTGPLPATEPVGPDPVDPDPVGTA